jgi:hypothetical protein
MFEPSGLIRVSVPWISKLFFLQIEVISFAFNPQPGALGPCIYVLQCQGGPVIPPGTGFLFHRLLRLLGRQWRYSNPHPHGEELRIKTYKILSCLLVFRAYFHTMNVVYVNPKTFCLARVLICNIKKSQFRAFFPSISVPGFAFLASVHLKWEASYKFC